MITKYPPSSSQAPTPLDATFASIDLKLKCMRYRYKFPNEFWTILPMHGTILKSVLAEYFNQIKCEERGKKPDSDTIIYYKMIYMSFNEDFY